MGYDFKVTVVEATGLPNKDGLFNKSDPYVELYGCARASAVDGGEPDWSAKERVVTKTVSGTLDPKFDEDFQMAVKDPEDVVYFRVFDCNMMKDKLMGTACLSAAEFVSGTETERKLQIVGTNYKRPDAGCLRVRVTAAFNGALANLTHEVDRMSRENDAFAANNRRLEGAINELEGEVDRMAGENARFEASNVKLEENVNRMEAENDRFAKNNEALEAQVSQLGEENEQFAENNEKLEAQVTAMTVENEKFSENNAKLAGQVEAMAAENEAFARNNETMARENEKLAASTAELQAQVGALSGENAKFQETNSAFAANTETMAAENARLAESNAALESELSKLAEETEKLAATNDALEASVERQAAEVANMAEENDKHKALNAKMAEENRKLAGVRNSLEGIQKLFEKSMKDNMRAMDRSLLDKVAADCEFMDQGAGLTEAEFAGFLDRVPQHLHAKFEKERSRFKQLDKNHDGVLSAGEMRDLLNRVMAEPDPAEP